MDKLTVVSGDKYGYLTVIKEVEPVKRIRRVLCRCKCGNKITRSLSDLRAKRTFSCGCLASDKLKLSEINVEDCLKNKCPPKITVSADKHAAIKYAIWLYVNSGEKLTVIADNIEVVYQTLMYWLKKLGVYEKSTSERCRHNSPALKRTASFKRLCKELYDAGYPTYTAIAKELGCDATIISEVAKEKGWCTNLPTRKFKWVVPKNLPKNTIHDYNKYKRTIYHFSKKMVRLYFSDEDKAKLKTGNYDVDHILSISEGFSRGTNAIPWQLLCHPANLQVLTRIDNLLKNSRSDHSPKELKLKIKAFDKEYGAIKLPIQI